MSVPYLPYFVDSNPIDLTDENLGRLSHNEYLAFPSIQRRNTYNDRVFRDPLAPRESETSIKENEHAFQVNLTVQHFGLEDISVKTVDGYLYIDFIHDEKEDEQGFISRSISRRYQLPGGVDMDSVKSKLSSDGVLTVIAPFKAPPKAENARFVPIVETGPVSMDEDTIGFEE